MPSEHNNSRCGGRRRQNDNDDVQDRSPSGALLATVGGLAFIAGALVFTGLSRFFCEEEKTEEDTERYYCLPSVDEAPPARPRDGGGRASSHSETPLAADEKVDPNATEHRWKGSDTTSVECGGAWETEAESGNLCVCCYARRHSFMFVSCRHICLCEACLIQLGRSYEENTRHARFNGPVRMPCPICRTVGYVIKTFSS